MKCHRHMTKTWHFLRFFLTFYQLFWNLYEILSWFINSYIIITQQLIHNVMSVPSNLVKKLIFNIFVRKFEFLFKIHFQTSIKAFFVGQNLMYLNLIFHTNVSVLCQKSFLFSIVRLSITSQVYANVISIFA